MSGSKTIDTAVNQVLPGYSKTSLVETASNVAFGLSPDAYRDLLATLKAIDPSWDLNAINFRDQEAIKRGFHRFVELNCRPPQTGTLPFVFSFQNLGANFASPAQFYSSSNANGTPNTSERWVLPVPPSDISVTVPNSQQEVTTVGGFTYTHAGNIQLDEISFESFLPYINLTSADYIPSFMPDYLTYTSDGYDYSYRHPQAWVQNLVMAMRANQPIIFSVYATDQTGAAVTDGGMIIEPTAMTVTAFDWSMGTSVGGSRRDVNYSITLKRWRRQSICITNYVKQKTTTDTEATEGAGGGINDLDGGVKLRKYTVKSGDSLRRIAQRLLKNAHRWQEIYNIPANKKKIGSNPNLIFAGTVLMIPRE